MYIIKKKKKNIFNIELNKYKRYLRWKKENNRIYNLYKEYILINYEYNKNNLKFNITKTMKIKVFLWISPSIVTNNDSIIEIKTLTERINILLMYKMKLRLWKVFK